MSSGKEMHDGGGAQSDSEQALQRELLRESTEGSDAIGDVRANRNLSGSSTWETVPPERQPEGVADRPSRAEARPADPAGAERRRAEEEIAVRLRRRGVRLNGRETGEELVETLEAVERFEAAVEAGGGDLMMDEPVGAGAPIQPDDRAFVLPRRNESESITAFIERLAFATARARQKAR